MTPDQKGLHYLTCANQVQLDRENKSPGIQNGGTMFSYSPYAGLSLLPAQRLPRLALLRRGTLARHRRQRPLRLALRRFGGHRQGRRRHHDSRDREPPIILSATPSSSRSLPPKAVNFPLYLRVPRWCEAHR